MIHPALGQLYAIRYISRPTGEDVGWNSFRIRREATALAEVQDSMDRLHNRFPGVKGRLLWWDESAGLWKEITLGPDPKLKFALFSED